MTAKRDDITPPFSRCRDLDRNRFAQQLFTPLPQRYDRLAEVLSMGQNVRWRRAMVDRIVPHSPSSVLDVASGTAGSR
jgi:demethylmenaquinone methyltransferase/2-methoxy-6-polyprenyl-1,4-benzoquinol methylase